jgi:hypothetical protein
MNIKSFVIKKTPHKTYSLLCKGTFQLHSPLKMYTGWILIDHWASYKNLLSYLRLLRQNTDYYLGEGNVQNGTRWNTILGKYKDIKLP